MELQDPGAMATEVEAALGEVERQLVALTREGGAGARPLEEVIEELTVLAQRLHPLYARLLDALEPRDLTYEVMTRIEAVRKWALWIYRRTRLEHVFYSKLQLERSLREALYRQVLETYDDFSVLELRESRLRGMAEAELAADLLAEPRQPAE